MSGSIYKVGVHLYARDEVSVALGNITKLSRELHAVVTKLSSGFEKMAAGAAEPFAAVGKHFGTLAERGELATKSLGEAFSKFDSQLGRTGLQIARLRSDLDYFREDAAAVGRIRMPGGGGGGGHVRPGQPGGGGHGGPGGHVGLQLGLAGLIGVEAVGHGMVDVVKQASELRHVQEQMIQGGFKNKEIAEALSASWKSASRYGIDVAKVMGDIKELRTPFGSTEHAINFIDPLERMRVVLDAVSEGSGTNSRDAIYKMARAGELKGLNDAGDYLKYFDAMTKVISATGGKVGPNDFMQATKYSRLAAMGFNQEYYTQYLPTLIQSLGASGAGTANAALFGTLIQGKASGRSIQAMDDLGLIGDRSKLFYKNGTKDIAGFHSGAIVDSALLTANPLEWVRKDLLPKLEKKFGDISIDSNRTKAIDNLGDFFGNRMSAQAVGEMAFRLKSFDRDKGLLQGARGLEGADRLLDSDPVEVAKKLKGAWENLLKAIGGPLVDPAIVAMNSIAAGVTKLSDWVNAHPGVVQQVAAAAAGLAAGLGVLTAAGVVAAAALLGPAGAIGVAIATIGGAITGLAALNWDVVAGGFTKVWNAVKGFGDFLSNLLPGSNAGKGKPLEGLDLPGVDQSYMGAGDGLLKRMSYGGGDVGSDGQASSSPVAVAVKSGVLDAFKAMMGGGVGSGSGGGGGFMNASFGGGGGGGFAGGTWNGKTLSVGSGTGVGHTASQQERAAFIRSTAAELGIDPATALRVAQSEGFYKYTGDQGRSFGDFQMFTGGGLGNIALQRGIDIRDPHNWKAADRLALQIAAQKRSWADWHGARKVGIGDHQGFGFHGSAPPTHVEVPPSKKGKEVVVHANLHLDRKKVATHVVTALLDHLHSPSKGSQMPDDSRANFGPGMAYNPSFTG